MDDFINEDGAVTYICPCDSELVMVDFTNSPLGTDSIHNHGNDKLGLDGNAYFDVVVTFEDILGSYKDSIAGYDTDYSVQNIVVAVIDAGIDKNMESLENHIWVNPNPEQFPNMDDPYGYDFTKWRRTSEEIDPHGTLVSQIIVDPNAEMGESVPAADRDYIIKLLDARAFDETGKGYLFEVLCAMSYAIQKKVDIINMSWGFFSNDFETEQLMYKYIRRAKQNNIILIASAGNSPDGPINTDITKRYPSGFNSLEYGYLGLVLSVASLNSDRTGLADYSNYGSNSIGIAAMEGIVRPESGIEETESLQGTSFAAPVVTRKAAQLKALNSGLSSEEIINCIMEVEKEDALKDKVISQGELNTARIECP